MKCLCGYEKEYNWDNEDGKKPFIQISCLGKAFETDVKTEYYCESNCETRWLYACPQCGMVLIDLDE